MRRLSPSSYGVLAMLAMRPWSAYELSTKVRFYLSQCLGPRAETTNYQEPKTLVAHGLARATTETYGRRTRTVYSITAEGRRALRKWLRAPSAPPVFFSEAWAKTVFGEYGDRKALIATLTQLEQQIGEMRREGTEKGASGYFADIGVTPERIAHMALAGRLYAAHFDLVESWARSAREEVETWPDRWPDELPPGQLEAFLTRFAQLLNREDSGSEAP